MTSPANQSLSWREYARLPVLALRLAVVCISLRWVSLPRLQRALMGEGRQTDSGSAPSGTLERARRLGFLINGLSRRLHLGRCLQRSLTLGWCLKGGDLDARLRIGLRGEAGGPHAHAWIEARGQVINDRCDIANGFERVGSIGSDLEGYQWARD